MGGGVSITGDSQAGEAAEAVEAVEVGSDERIMMERKSRLWLAGSDLSTWPHCQQQQ